VSSSPLPSQSARDQAHRRLTLSPLLLVCLLQDGQDQVSISIDSLTFCRHDLDPSSCSGSTSLFPNFPTPCVLAFAPLDVASSLSSFLPFHLQLPVIPSSHFTAPIRIISSYSEYKKLHATLAVVELEALKDRLRRGDERSVRKLWENRESNFLRIYVSPRLRCGTWEERRRSGGSETD